MEHPPHPKWNWGKTQNGTLTTLNISTLDKGAKALTPQIAEAKLSPQETKLKNLKTQLADLEEYPKKDRLEFYDFWTESNTLTSSKKMKFENKKSFDVGRRMKKWMSNKKEWASPNKAKEDKSKIIREATLGMSFEEGIKWQVDNGYISKEVMKGWE